MNKEQSIAEAIKFIENREKSLSSLKRASIVVFVFGLATFVIYIYVFPEASDMAEASRKFNDLVTHEQHSLLLDIVDSKIKLALTAERTMYGPKLFMGFFLMALSITYFFLIKARRDELAVIKNVLYAVKKDS